MGIFRNIANRNPVKTFYLTVSGSVASARGGVPNRVIRRVWPPLLMVFFLVNIACTTLSDSGFAPSGENDEALPADFVSESFIRHHLEVLAHDTLEGRGTGQPGSQKSADYIHDFYSSFDKSMDFELIRQPFTLEGRFWDSVTYTVYYTEEEDTVLVSVSELEKDSEASFYPVLGGSGLLDAPVVFAGFDPSADGFSVSGNGDHDMQNAWVMVFEGDYDETAQEAGEGGQPPPDRNELVRRISGHYGAIGVIFITDDQPEQWRQTVVSMSRQLERPMALGKPGMRFRGAARSVGNAVAVDSELAMKILGFSDREQLDSLHSAWKKPEENPDPMVTGFRLRNDPVINARTFTEENIITVIPGRDEELKEEIIVISAHYDHMGLGEPDHRNDIVYNGADDNASGSAVLMQIAEAFRKAAEYGSYPSRTLVFLHTAAEEWGLYGSRFYVQNPVHPLDDIAASVNIDMVGYVDNEYAETDDTDYIYVIGAGMMSSLLEEVLNRSNRESVELNLDEKYNSTRHPSGLYRRSDQWAFGERNIPFVFFFSGLHDYYHTPSDTADRISWSLLAKRAELITEFVWRLSNSEERPESDRRELGSPPAHSR